MLARLLLYRHFFGGRLASDVSRWRVKQTLLQESNMRRLKWLVLCASVVVATTAASVASYSGASFFDPKCALDEAAEWAEANSDALPRSLAAVKTLPLVYQKAVVARLDVSERAAIWRAHFEEVLGQPDVRLTDDQTRAMAEIDANLEATLSSPMSALTARMALRTQVFDRALRYRLFSSLDDAREVNQTNGKTNEGDTNGKLPNCSCNNVANDCGGPFSPLVCEVTMHISCDDSSWGCGFLWTSGCNGSCMAAQ
jgi:hypothetical protein